MEHSFWRRALSVRSALAIGLLIALAGCDLGLPAPPESAPAKEPLPVAARSTISVPLVVDVEGLKSSAINKLRSKPIFAHETPELSVKLLTEEKTILQQPRKVIDVPFAAAACQVKKVPRQISRHVKVGVETFGCWLNPLKWGNCVRDVFKDIVETVYDDVTECTKEQVEVAHMVMDPVIQLTEKVFDVSAVVKYSALIDDLTLTLEGDQLNLHVRVKVPVSADVKTSVFTESITAKGLLACDSMLELNAKVAVQLVQSGSTVEARASLNDFHPELQQLCVPGAVQLTQALSLSSVDAFALSKALEAVITSQLEDLAKSALADQASSLALGQVLSTAATKLRIVSDLGGGLWLKAAPSQALVSQITGSTVAGRQILSATAGIEADLSVIYGAKPVDPTPPGTAPPPVPVVLGASGNAFHLAARGTVQLSRVREVLLKAISDAAGEKIEKAGFELKDIRVYQSDQRLAIAVAVKARSFWEPSGSFYLVAEPKYDPATSTVRFADLDFTVDTKNWLAKNVAGLAHQALLKAVQDKAVFAVGGAIGAVQKQFKSFSIPLAGGTIKGTTTVPKVDRIFMYGDAINVDVSINGTAQLELKL